MSSYLELCQKFQSVTGITAAATVSVLNQTGMNLKIVTFIADADIEIQNLWQDWKFLDTEKAITLLPTVDAYSLSVLSLAGLLTSWKEKSFYINPGTANYALLSDVPYQEWQSSAARLGAKSSRQPSKVVIKPDNSLVFIDTPDIGYTVWASYFRAPVRLAANADTSPIPVANEMAIIWRAQMMYCEFYEHWELYGVAKNNFQDALVALEAVQLTGQESRTRSTDDPEDNRIVCE